MQDAGVSERAENRLNLAGIKGEKESAQIIITAKKNISYIDINVNSLTDIKGNSISKTNIDVFAEKYIEVLNPFINSGTTNITFPALSGFYPDALLPFEVYKKYGENKVVEGQNQGIWIDINIPLTAAAGDYKGELEVIIDKETQKVPVTLKVYDINMPDEVHSRTALNIWHTQLAYGEKTNYDENTNQIYYDFLLEKRLCSAVTPMGKFRSMDEIVEDISVLSLDPRVTVYKIWNEQLGIDDTSHLSLNAPSIKDLPYEEKLAKHELACEKTYNGIKTLLKKMLDKTLEMEAEHPGADLFKKATFHFEDEPSRGYRTERTRKFNEIFTAAKRDFISENEGVFNARPYLKDSLLYSFKDMTPTDMLDDGLFVSEKEDGTPDYEKGDGVTLWVIHCHKVENSAARNVIKQRQALGEQFWWYTCVRTSPVPSFYLEAVTMNIRLQSWQQYEHGVEGMLYWDVVHWEELPDCDPFISLQYGSFGNGEGILLYPGYKYGLKTPISSIRLENISQGQEDYEYLYLLDGYLKEYNVAHGTDYDAREIVARLIKDLHSGCYLKKTATPEKLEEVRIAVLDILELFAKGKSKEAISVINSLF